MVLVVFLKLEANKYYLTIYIYCIPEFAQPLQIILGWLRLLVLRKREKNMDHPPSSRPSLQQHGEVDSGNYYPSHYQMDRGLGEDGEYDHHHHSQDGSSTAEQPEQEAEDYSPPLHGASVPAVDMLAEDDDDEFFFQEEDDDDDDLDQWMQEFVTESDEEDLFLLEEEEMDEIMATILPAGGETHTSRTQRRNEGQVSGNGYQSQDTNIMHPVTTKASFAPSVLPTTNTTTAHLSQHYPQQVSFLQSPSSNGARFLQQLSFTSETAAQKSTKTYDQLKSLLERHYQLLIQQAVLVLRQTKQTTSVIDPLVQMLDGAVGMLQDMDQNRKDAIRKRWMIQDTVVASRQRSPPAASSYLVLNHEATSHLTQLNASENNIQHSTAQHHPRRWTRAQFQKTLRGQLLMYPTVFDVAGVQNLAQTFHTLDNQTEKLWNFPDDASACRFLLDAQQTPVLEEYLPNSKDLSEHFVDPKELLGPDFKGSCDDNQQALLKKNKNAFTTGEDNLLLRGVNQYGEKQWPLISDRYMPDRSSHILSNRFNKLCTMIFRKRGVSISDNGELKTPPKYEGVEYIDQTLLASLKPVEAPAVADVHRWSLEEDITLLKAVEIMGNMWAEISSRYVPHRDRGPLRKRYQVLERRVKNSVTRQSAKSSPSGKTRKTETTPATVRKNFAGESTGTAKMKDAGSKRVEPTRAQGASNMSTTTSQLPVKKQPVPSFPPLQSNRTIVSAKKSNRKRRTLEPFEDSNSRQAFELILNSDVSHVEAENSRLAVEHIIGEKFSTTGESSRTAFQSLLEQESRHALSRKETAQEPKRPAPLSEFMQEETSRLAFEKLLQEDATGFSQLSNVNDATKKNSNTNFNLLAESIHRSSKQEANPLLKGASSRQIHAASGATLLDNSKIRKKKKPKRARLSNVENDSASKKMPPPTSPSKRHAIEGKNVRTPARETNGFFYSTNGTPVGFSPAFNPESPSMKAVTGQTMDGFETNRILDFPIDGHSNHSVSTPGLSNQSFLVDTDLAAINALSNMSSTATHPKTEGESKSLFDKVVGEKKRKLDFH